MKNSKCEFRSLTNLLSQAVRIRRSIQIFFGCLIKKARKYVVIDHDHDHDQRTSWSMFIGSKYLRNFQEKRILPCDCAISAAVSFFMDLMPFDAPDFNKKYTNCSLSKGSNWTD